MQRFVKLVGASASIYASSAIPARWWPSIAATANSTAPTSADAICASAAIREAVHPVARLRRPAPARTHVGIDLRLERYPGFSHELSIYRPRMETSGPQAGSAQRPFLFRSDRKVSTLLGCPAWLNRPGLTPVTTRPLVRLKR